MTYNCLQKYLVAHPMFPPTIPIVEHRRQWIIIKEIVD